MAAPEPKVSSLYKDDSVRFDTSKAPWMAKAYAELGKKIQELRDNNSFEQLWYQAMVAAKNESDDLSKDVPHGYSLFGRKGMPDLIAWEVQRADKARGAALAARNAEIAKYFENLESDPSFDPKGKSYDVAPVNHGAGDWQITAWCAAFVNWCLEQTGMPHLGYSTAISWLDFGTPLPAPVFGCITVVPPAKSTGSTTGHVAFYEKTVGNSVVLVGGNQSHQVKRSSFSRVLGYRWPTAFNYYYTPETGRSSIA